MSAVGLKNASRTISPRAKTDPTNANARMRLFLTQQFRKRIGPGNLAIGWTEHAAGNVSGLGMLPST